MMFKLIPGEYNHNALPEPRDTPICEDKAYNRSARGAVDEEVSTGGESDSLKAEGVKWLTTTAVVIEVKYK